VKLLLLNKGSGLIEDIKTEQLWSEGKQIGISIFNVQRSFLHLQDTVLHFLHQSLFIAKTWKLPIICSLWLQLHGQIQGCSGTR
jgi:hypothetical protein